MIPILSFTMYVLVYDATWEEDGQLGEGHDAVIRDDADVLRG